MNKHIVIFGAGAVGGYVGGRLASAGHDVTLVDVWHEHIETIRRDGLALSGLTEEESIVARPRTLHLHEASTLASGPPVDIAIVAVKSYDTDWVTTLLRPHLAPSGYVVSLQNCINEETIAGIVGWGRTLGCVVSRISVELHAPGAVRRQSRPGTAARPVFKIGEVHGRITPRVTEMAALLGDVDAAAPTTDLWGERWSKLAHNAMRNPVSAATGLRSKEIDRDPRLRDFVISLGAEAAQIGRALGYGFDTVGELDAEPLLRVAEGDEATRKELDSAIAAAAEADTRGSLQRPSMGQDTAKGRRTEIEFLNGYIADKGRSIGIPAPANEKIVELVLSIQRRERPVSADNASLLA